MKLRTLLYALRELTDEQLEMTATVLNTETMELEPIIECTLLSELPSKSRYILEDRVDIDAPLFVIYDNAISRLSGVLVESNKENENETHNSDTTW